MHEGDARGQCGGMAGNNGAVVKVGDVGQDGGHLHGGAHGDLEGQGAKWSGALLQTVRKKFHRRKNTPARHW